jgi:hypothetical protein
MERDKKWYGIIGEKRRVLLERKEERMGLGGMAKDGSLFIFLTIERTLILTYKKPLSASFMPFLF